MSKRDYIRDQIRKGVPMVANKGNLKPEKGNENSGAVVKPHEWGC